MKVLRIPAEHWTFFVFAAKNRRYLQIKECNAICSFDSCSKKREMEKTDSAITAGFCSVVVSFALHAKGPRFKTEWKQLFPFEEKYEPFALSVALRMLYLMRFSPSVHLKISACFQEIGFRSVVVITFASHAKGPQFETGGNNLSIFHNCSISFLSVARPRDTSPWGVKVHPNNRKISYEWSSTIYGVIHPYPTPKSNIIKWQL